MALQKKPHASVKRANKLPMDDAQWRSKLTEKQYAILRKRQTEPAFSGSYLYNKQKGKFVCAGCSQPLFSSDTKFDSGTGWPSFYNVLNNKNVTCIPDTSFGMDRTEVVCSRCGGHLGHVFNDGPTKTSEGKPCTGLRYCINSAALSFTADKKE